MSDYTSDIVIREKIATTLELDIDEYCEKSNLQRKSRRLGSSQIGYGCSRRIWYHFRWAKSEILGDDNRSPGQVVRLFNRGHREEPVLIKHLEDIGCKFEKLEGDKQFEYSSCENHAVTKLDAVGYLPEKFKIPDKCLFEFKTANESMFRTIRKDGMRRATPSYWSQICFSGYLAKLNYCVFIVVNKNNDDLLIEFLKIDLEYGKMLEDKALSIITAKQPPLKIAQSATNYACKFCQFANICHYDEPVEVNCRSCVHCSAANNGKFVCNNPEFGFEKGYSVIPEDVIPNGCPNHKGID